MRKLAWVVACVAVCASGSQLALGWGGNHPKGREVSNPEWPKGVAVLVNGAEWVRGWWVNANDVFCYQGGTAALNGFLKQYAQVEGTEWRVILHDDKGVCSGLGGDERVPMDWRLEILRRGWGGKEPARPEPGLSNYEVVVHVWLGGGIDLKKLKVPQFIEITPSEKAAGFAAEHRKVRPKPEGPAALERLWDDLAKENYAVRRRAALTLAAGRDEAARFLARRLEPVTVDPDQVARWIAELDSDKHEARGKAHDQLAALGLAAMPALEAAQKRKLSAEAASRVEALLARRASLALRVEHAVLVLVEVRSPQCLKILRNLAKGAPALVQTKLAKQAIETVSPSASKPSSQPGAGKGKR
ncbi:MAG TPA: hypothetical protein VNA25_26060 [Phycisphaerae bacterium]|nr:hypothetical protein [Phycisphaerae bacterium]